MKKGIKASELRPFSVEDPFGLGIETPSQRKHRERFHRKVDRKRTPGKTAQERAAAARPLARERRRAPTQAASAQAQSQALAQSAPSMAAPTKTAPSRKAPAQSSSGKKGCGCGCLTTLLILGVLFTLGQLLVPLVIDAIEQEIVSNTGRSAYGRILKAAPTDLSFNNKTIYELTVEVHGAGRPPYQVTLKQALEPAQANAAQIGAWTTLRYDENDQDSIVLERLGIDPPSPDALSDRGTPDISAPQDATRGFKFDVRATASVSTDNPNPTTTTPKSGSPTSPTPTGTAPANPNGAKGAASAGVPTPTTSPAPAQSPAPAASRPENAATSPSEAGASTPPVAPPPSEVLPACRRAAACCVLAGGDGCGQFAVPGKEKRECNQAFNAFKKQAAAAGKTCQ